MHDSLKFRIWTDVTGLAMPLAAMAVYVLVGPSPVTTALTALSLAAIVGTWAATTDLRRWRAARVARLRRLRLPRRDPTMRA